MEFNLIEQPEITCLLCPVKKIHMYMFAGILLVMEYVTVLKS